MDEIIPPLSAAEVRVLGSLIEKAVTTPDYYPLSLGALTNACNQLSNREPVVSYDESDVLVALDGLRKKRLASQFQGADSRVAKYKHGLTEVLLLTPAELALLCVLMLRGPQTLGELRTRAERLSKFAALSEVEETLQALALRQPNPLVAKLPRQFGMKEARYSQLLSSPPEALAPEPGTPVESAMPVVDNVDTDRIAKLEVETVDLRRDVDELKQQLAELKKQWE
jgi:uncharacterized protein